MQLKPFSFKQFLLKVCLFLAIFYAFVLSTSILITAYLFFSLDSYKTRIEGVIFKHTGYDLKVGEIRSSLSSSLMPEITIKNAQLINPMDTKQNFSVKQLQFIFSYSSIWNLEPIFDQINIDGTNLNFEYLKDGSIIFNGININHPDKKTIENTKNSPIDLELWILKQKQIKLSNINLSFEDKKNNLPKLELYNVTTVLRSGFRHHHTFTLAIGRSQNDQKQMLGAKLTWIGGKVTQFDEWKEAQFKVQSYNDNDQIAGTVRQYIPGISIMDEFNADTAIEAQVKNGKLQFLYANFDVKNLRYVMTHHQNLINFPQLGGNIRISLVNGNHYTLEANNLNISTPNGYIFNNKSILGNYIIGKKGDLSINNTDIKAFNNLIKMFPATSKFNLSGTLEIIKLSWLGKITHPNSFNILINFKDLAIISKDPEIPDINHMSGSASINKDDGYVNLYLKNSTLNYPKMFLIPYKFNVLSTKISWQFNPDKTFDVILGNTIIDTIDFKGTAQGKYTYTPGTNGFLDMTAHVDRVLTSKVGDYLPIVIGMPVHKWLNKGLIGGYGANARLTLKGWIANFPFTDGNGIFYIDADIDHGQLNYVDNWPTLDNIIGKFQIRNQKIIITANSGQIAGNSINKATVVIPDMTGTTEPAHLIADGEASGTTSNFMTYLKRTPINEIIGKIPEKVTTAGNGVVKIHLMVPFAHPMQTKVDGNYTFVNNTIQFDLPIPVLTSVNGVLFFNEHGIKIDKLSTKALNSEENLTATTAKSGAMQFSIFSPNLDLNAAANYYAPYLSPVISGRAPANINFDISKKGVNQIQVHSRLRGITVDAPIPLGKESSVISSLDLTMIPNHSSGEFEIDINYADSLYGKILLNQHGKLNRGYLSLGKSTMPELTPNQPKIIVSVNTPVVPADLWLSAIIKVFKEDSKKTSAKNSILIGSESIVLTFSKAPESTSDIFPLEILVNTANLKTFNSSYYHSNMDILIFKDKTLFNINNALTNGFGSYTYANRDLDILINELNILNAFDSVETSKKNTPPAWQGKSAVDFIRLNQSQAVNTGNSAIFNESAYTLKLTRQNLKSFIESTISPAMSFPSTNLVINNLLFENVRLAVAKVKLRPVGMDLMIESGDIEGKITHTTFHGANYCMECGADKAFVELLAHIKVTDLGQMLDNLGYVDIVAKGSGDIDLSLQWSGKLQDFKLAHTIAVIKIDLKNGKFLKVSTGNILGEIVGLINLQTITNFAHLDFSEAFSNGFYFNTLKIRAYLLNNVLTIKSLYMSGPLATVQSYGTIDINNETVDSYLSIAPKLGAGIAVGAGVATLNPFIGLAVYAGEWILGEPFNKLFSFAYHVTGSLKTPTLTKVKISQQVLNNLNSALGVSSGTAK